MDEDGLSLFGVYVGLYNGGDLLLNAVAPPNEWAYTREGCDYSPVLKGAVVKLCLGIKASGPLAARGILVAALFAEGWALYSDPVRKEVVHITRTLTKPPGSILPTASEMFNPPLKLEYTLYIQKMDVKEAQV